MSTDDLVCVVEGIEDVISRDLDQHKAELERTTTELQAFRGAKRHESKKRKNYEALVAAGRFNAEAMQRALVDIDINIKHMSDRIAACEKHIEFEKVIVDTLTEQLANQHKALAQLAEYRREHPATE